MTKYSSPPNESRQFLYLLVLHFPTFFPYIYLENGKEISHSYLHKEHYEGYITTQDTHSHSEVGMCESTSKLSEYLFTGTDPDPSCRTRNGVVRKTVTGDDWKSIRTTFTFTTRDITEVSRRYC